MSEYKTIFHVDELDKWELTLKNAINLSNELKNEKKDIIILANAKAVMYYFNVSDLLDVAKNQNIIFIACQNALNIYQSSNDVLPHYVNVVKAGVLELTIKQHEGYAYIKP